MAFEKIQFKKKHRYNSKETTRNREKVGLSGMKGIFVRKERQLRKMECKNYEHEAAA